MIDKGVKIRLYEVETMPLGLYCRSDAYSGSPVIACMGAWTRLPKILGEVVIPSSDGSIAPTECLTVLCFCQLQRHLRMDVHLAIRRDEQRRLEIIMGPWIA